MKIFSRKKGEAFNSGKRYTITEKSYIIYIIDGWHYFYCAWWNIDVGLPKYKDRDRKFFLFARKIYTETNIQEGDIALQIIKKRAMLIKHRSFFMLQMFIVLQWYCLPE